MHVFFIKKCYKFWTLMIIQKFVQASARTLDKRILHKSLKSCMNPLSKTMHERIPVLNKQILHKLVLKIHAEFVCLSSCTFVHELSQTNPAQIFYDGDRSKMRAPENKRSSDMKKEKEKEEIWLKTHCKWKWWGKCWKKWGFWRYKLRSFENYK